MAIYKRCDRCQKDITDAELVKVDAVIKKPTQWTRGFFPFKTVNKMYCMDCFLKYIVNDIKTEIRNIKEGVV